MLSIRAFGRRDIQLWKMYKIRKNLCNFAQVLYFFTYPKRVTVNEALPLFFGTGEKGIYFRGTGEQRQNVEGDRGRIQYWGTEYIQKQIFDFWGTGKQANLFQGNMGTGTPWEGLVN